MALTDVREALATRIKELQDQQDTKTTRPDESGMRRFKSFDMGSDFPHASPLIHAAGHECYRSKSFRILWTLWTSHIGLTIWSHTDEADVPAFLRWASHAIREDALETMVATLNPSLSTQPTATLPVYPKPSPYIPPSSASVNTPSPPPATPAPKPRERVEETSTAAQQITKLTLVPHVKKD